MKKLKRRKNVGKKYTKEFAEHEVTISRGEFAEKSARIVNNILEAMEKDNVEMPNNISDIRILLSVFLAELMLDVFDELEVEPNGN
jgi:hypothetical protein